MENIQFEDFAKLDIRIGTIKTAEKVEDADRLFVFKVDVGEENERQIISGVAEYFSEPEDLVGKQVPVLMNLEPRRIRGIESQGMILYVSDEEGLTTLEPGREMISGSVVK
ncbi:methionine--tRNA ligase subunit beta [Patescibacteria group bacterium]|nr:methionine--tRNA ligase subunit beta [Patescibacteria group bacterium]